MNATILIADSGPQGIDSPAAVARGLGCVVELVREPEKILATAQAVQPVLILQDLAMPGLNFAGLVAAFRLNPATAQIPLAFLGAGEAKRDAYDAIGYLSRPVDRQALADLVRRAVVRSETRKGADVQREVRAHIHGQWNLLAALSNYVLLLDGAEGLGPDAQRAVTGLDGLLLKLESKTDRLSMYLRGLVASLEPVPGTEPVPPESGGPA